MNRVSFEEIKNMIQQSATVTLNEEQKERSLLFVENVQNLVLAANALVDEAEGLLGFLQRCTTSLTNDSDLEYLPAVRNALREF